LTSPVFYDFRQINEESIIPQLSESRGCPISAASRAKP